jgi:hypothetical protein
MRIFGASSGFIFAFGFDMETRKPRPNYTHAAEPAREQRTISARFDERDGAICAFTLRCRPPRRCVRVRRGKTRVAEKPASLAKQGIDKNLPDRARKEAAKPEDKFSLAG